MSKEDAFISEKRSKGEIGRDILISLCASMVFVYILLITSSMTRLWKSLCLGS